MLEKQIENKIKRQLDSWGILWIKIHGGKYQEPGLPDLIINYYGRMIMVEVKQGRNRPTRIQAAKLMKFYQEGALVFVINEENIDNFLSLLDPIGEVELLNANWKKLIQVSKRMYTEIKRSW